MTTARVKEDGAPRFFGGRMKLKLGVVVLAALAIELVNFFLLAFPIDVGDPPGTPWYLQLLGDQWVALHAIGLFSLGWFERVCGCQQLNVVMSCRRVDTIVLFAGGYLTTAFLVFGCMYAFQLILRSHRKLTRIAARVPKEHLG